MMPAVQRGAIEARRALQLSRLEQLWGDDAVEPSELDADDVGRTISQVRPRPIGDAAGSRGPAFLDRRDECAALDELLGVVRAGESRALVISGEPGVGKTALLEYLVGQASGCRVVRASGVQSEVELAFAGLHQLCVPLLGFDKRLPGPQREALERAFWRRLGPAPNRFLVGVAVLELLAVAAEEKPLLCVIDDAQWLDSASLQTLAFVARRLAAESVALVFAAPDEVPELNGLPELQVSGLPHAAARQLLRSVLHGPVDDRVLDRIVAETRGNPLALLELPNGLTSAGVAAGVAIGFGLPSERTLPRRIEESYQRQLAPLPDATRRLLLLASADPTGDPVLVWRAAEMLGIGLGAAGPAVSAGLLEIDVGVRFRHPLLRSAVYKSASAQQRRAVHRALAQATDPEADPDRRVWHIAQATSTPDEEVADELERAATCARARCGLAAAAAFLERSAQLTSDPARRTQRALAAAQVRFQAGAPDSALSLLSMVEAGPLDELSCARAELLRAQIAFSVSRGRDAPPLLLNAARRLEPLDVRLARETYLEALDAAGFAGRLAGDVGMREVAEAARSVPPSPLAPRPADLLLDGLVTRLTEGYAPAVEMLRRALSAFRGPNLSDEDGLRWLWLAGRTARDLWDDESLRALAIRHVRLAREAGALTVLPLALASRVIAHTFVGELTEAESLLTELTAVSEAIGNPLVPLPSLLFVAWRGRESEVTEVIEVVTRQVVDRGEGNGLTICGWAKALLCNSLGRYQEALDSAEDASERLPIMGGTPWGVLVELIEAASRSGMPERAVDALRQLGEATRASGTQWALGIEARCRALCTDGLQAEGAYQESIARLHGTGIRGELARAHLVYGEWLRRKNRRIDARYQLRTAHEMFTEMGMEAFAGRAAQELAATGETARKRNGESQGELTAHERQIARLAGEGLSNPEIAARLFISPRTVEWHLNKVYCKLEITSRKQLQRLGGGPSLDSRVSTSRDVGARRS
jgi:DNA-binding CsgD family transcriptional regulator